MWEIFWGCGVCVIIFLVSVEGKLGGVIIFKWRKKKEIKMIKIFYK